MVGSSNFEGAMTDQKKGEASTNNSEQNTREREVNKSIKEDEGRKKDSTAVKTENGESDQKK